MTRYWIGIAVETHVMRGVAEGFAQLGHGRKTSIAALSCGDRLAYYAPRTTLEGRTQVQAFVAIGTVLTNAPYQVDLSDEFQPWRHDVSYDSGARKASIRPLLDRLALTRDRGTKWGIALRGSHREISPEDFRLIADAMGAQDLS